MRSARPASRRSPAAPSDGGGHFEQVALRPDVRFASPEHEERAAELHERAHHLCFIPNSVNFPVRCELPG